MRSFARCVCARMCVREGDTVHIRASLLRLSRNSAQTVLVGTVENEAFERGGE